MTLLERDEAIATLDGLLASAVAGKGRVAVITGAVASGKTELLNHYADRAVDRDALAITAAGSDAERNLPLGVISQLLLDAPLVPDDWQRAMNLLYEGVRADSGDKPIDPQIVHALCTILLELSQRYPLVIAVDDIDRADRASIVCLSYLARRVRFAPMLALFSQTEHSRPDDAAFDLETLWRPPHGTRIVLSPLTPGGVRAIAAETVGAADADRLGPAWHHLSGGNPLLLGGLLDDHRDAVAGGSATGGAPPGGAPPGGAAEPVAGEHYARAVVSCVRRSGARLLRVAHGIAVCSDPELLEQILPADSTQVTHAVRALTAAGLLAGGEFRHPVAREAVLADIDDRERVELFERAAVLAHRSGAASAVVAEHLVRAGEINDAWAVPVLEDAARQALREGRVAVAVRYLELALQACPDGQRRTRIITTLVRAEWRINPSAPTGYLPELAAALRGGHLRGTDALVLTKALLWHGQFADAGEVFEHISAHTDETDTETLAELAITRPLVVATYPSFRSLLHQGPQPSVTMPTVAASHRLEAANALAAVTTRGPSERAISTAERILHNSRLDEMSLDTVESALLALNYGGRPDAAAPWCDMFIEEAGLRKAPSRQARLAAIRAEIALRLGDLPAARRHAGDALTVMPPSSWGVAVGGPLAVLIIAATAAGDLGEVRDHLDQPVPEEMLQTRYGLHYLYARGRYSRAIGELPLALRDFQLCGRLTAQWGLDAPGLVPWRIEAAETLLRMNSAERAQQLVEDQLARCGKGEPRVRAMGLRLYAACSQPRHRPLFLRQAADLHTGGDEYELARTLVDLTEAFLLLGESRRAGMIARRARATAEKAGALPLLKVLNRDAGWDEGDTPGQPVKAAAGPAILSEAEHRVAALAAAGYTNREIAEKLYITISTVEQHLTRTFRKLNVTRRTDLPASLNLDAASA